jgi:hypothetical protein
LATESAWLTPADRWPTEKSASRRDRFRDWLGAAPVPLEQESDFHLVTDVILEVEEHVAVGQQLELVALVDPEGSASGLVAGSVRPKHHVSVEAATHRSRLRLRPRAALGAGRESNRYEQSEHCDHRRCASEVHG